MDLTPEQWRVLKRVLQDSFFQNIIGGEEWSLTEAEEMTLWDIIHKAEEGGKE